MLTLLKKLWTDEAYFRATLYVILGVVIPSLPLGEFGSIGYWLGRLAPGIALLVKAGEKNEPK